MERIDNSPPIATPTCLNKHCLCFGKDLPKGAWFRKIISHRYPGFEARCPECGFEFMKKFSSPQILVLSYGWVVKDKISSLITAGQSARAIEKSTGICRRSLKSILNSVRRVFKQRLEGDEFSGLRKMRREAWQIALKRSRSIKVAAVEAKTEYRWLQKRDREWLCKFNLRFHKKRPGAPRKDLTALDALVLAEARDTYALLISEQVAFRITSTSFTKRSNIIGATKLKLLPRSHHFITGVVEDTYTFLKRRVDHLIENHPTRSPVEVSWHLTLTTKNLNVRTSIQEYIFGKEGHFISSVMKVA